MVHRGQCRFFGGFEGQGHIELQADAMGAAGGGGDPTDLAGPRDADRSLGIGVVEARNAEADRQLLPFLQPAVIGGAGEGDAAAGDVLHQAQEYGLREILAILDRRTISEPLLVSLLSTAIHRMPQ